MSNIEYFLDEFTKRFCYSEEDKKIVKEADNFVINYTDGIFYFYRDNEGHALRTDDIYRSICIDSIFENKEYRFIWDNFIAKNTEFITWLEDHNLTEKDMMIIEGKLKDSLYDIDASFHFRIRF